MTVAVCPSREEIASLCRGDLSAERSAVLESHVDTCELCQGTLQSVDLERDWIAGDLGQASIPRQELDQELRGALERIRRYAPEVSQTISTVGVQGMLASLEPSLL